MNKMVEALNNENFLFLLMVMLHIIADYLVQTEFIANFKQKKNWENTFKDMNLDKNNKYKYDYIAILLVHAFSWSFITFFPIVLICNINIFLVSVVINTIIHAIVDDLKANKYKINLLIDQSLHLLQIVITLKIIGLII